MVAPTEWTDRDIEFLKENYWDMSYSTIADELGMSQSVVYRKAKDDLGLPKKRKKNEIAYRYGVPIGWLLDTLHNTLEKSVNTISSEIGVGRKNINRWMEDENVPRRGQSEAELMKWEQMSPEEREAQVEAAHEKNRELAANGELAMRRWRRENPEEARELSVKWASTLAERREENGMKGVTGQDHPNWRGGKSVYDAVKRQLPGPSWNTIRSRYESEPCENCGAETTDVHHIVPLLCGGTNDDYNLMPLCRSCHHEAEWHIRDLLAPVLVA